MSSEGRSGETLICSTVSCSFSRTMESDVAITAESMSSMPMSPGIRKRALSNSGLNQILGFGATTGSDSVAPVRVAHAVRSSTVARSARASR
jgi:hypothetical protein